VTCLLAALSPVPGNALADRGVPTVPECPERHRLVDLWHAMLDHSSDFIYNHTLFLELGKDLTQADSDIGALVERGAFSKPIADDLRGLFHSRYDYIEEYHYTDQARFLLTAAQSARITAQWLVELQLDVIRRARAMPEPDERLAAAAESNLAYELTFLQHLDKFEGQADQRRDKLKAGEESGEEVDWQAFENDCQRRRNLLLEAYRQRRLPRVRSVERLMPYLVALTTSQPSPASTSRDPEGPG
jgi:hypothetical protein